MTDWYSELYDAVTAQLEHERDAAEDADTREAITRVWSAVREVSGRRLTRVHPEGETDG